MYEHKWIDGSAVELPVGKVVCVGRNYAEHARELGNDVPAEPLLFIKPATALRDLNAPVMLPVGRGEVHHEVEIVVLIGTPLTDATPQAAQAAIAGYAVGLDLTLRELQSRLKERGEPWEKAKSFDGAAPVSGFVDARGVSTRQNLAVSLEVNNQVRQHGHSGQMLFPIFPLVAEISRHFTLLPGDVVYTGTPAGVAPLVSGDQLVAKLGNFLALRTSVA
ncbi:fumarylacetoacetate hydrolase family protein [Alcanivorax quisquiliarum]|uniref:Fumarylacetoacetate hydrolase family protein n=1 Tax=Alcanivorax quisquiliarum TaxID=2933565 RepID=A0ABT0E5G4_9GAMM|nr:fumarylacetoacetate hydrolase family protein [Alcanivorax quisquiliarum]MCK0537061.1 fumarylacetoacetate hydrolase family protein [Alcanivorax quisquiliarum]